MLAFEPRVLAFGCVYTNILEKRGVAGNYKCRHLLASLSPLGPPHPVVSAYITREASSQLGAETEHTGWLEPERSPLLLLVEQITRFQINPSRWEAEGP